MKKAMPAGRRGFTLVELLIAISLFTLAAVIASNILIDVVQLEKKTSVQNAIYEDLRIILQQLTNEIQSGAIDYEEYYSMNVIQAEPAAGDPFYGINYGVYASRFYNPGLKLGGGAGENPADLGVDCSFPNPSGGCEIYFTKSADLNTGQNFYNNEDLANAFCDNHIGHCENGDQPMNEFNELYLIDSTGTKKTIIGKKRVNLTDWAIGIVRMNGRDLDQNGVIDTFTCNSEFNCASHSTNIVNLFGPTGAIKLPNIETLITNQGSDYSLRVPQQSDLEHPFDINTSQFIPISPLRSTVKDLRFVINPVEDPYKAYAEDAVQSHPSVGIIITIGLSSDAAADYPGGAEAFGEITISTTVAAGVLGKIESYPPVDDVHAVGGESWIKAVFE